MAELQRSVADPRGCDPVSEEGPSRPIAGSRFYAVLLGVFAGMAVMLAAIGVYGIIAYSVANRTRQIGVRMTLGASRGDVLRLIVGQSLALTAAGSLIGIFGAVALTRYLEDMLFGLTPLDPGTASRLNLLLSSHRLPRGAREILGVVGAAAAVVLRHLRMRA